MCATMKLKVFNNLFVSWYRGVGHADTQPYNHRTYPISYNVGIKKVVTVKTCLPIQN